MLKKTVELAHLWADYGPVYSSLAVCDLWDLCGAQYGDGCNQGTAVMTEVAAVM